MIVYRYLGARELGEILRGNVAEIGKPFSRKLFRRANSHKYQEGIKYLHFFQNREDIEKIKFEHQSAPTDFYICEFDIPKKKLKKGVGRYTNHRGYEQYVERAREYIIPSQEFDCSWLQNYEFDQTHKNTQKEKCLTAL